MLRALRERVGEDTNTGGKCFVPRDELQEGGVLWPT